MDLPEDPLTNGPPPPPVPPRPNQFGYPNYGGQSYYPQYNNFRPNNFGVPNYGYSPYGNGYSPYGQPYGETYQGKSFKF